MRLKVVAGTIGTILKFFSVAFLVPIIPSFYFIEADLSAVPFYFPSSALVFILCFLITLLVGIFLEKLGSTEDFTDKEGFAIVSLGWIVIAFFASLPFVLTSSVTSLADAYFEAMSGLTTTGATVFSYPLELHLQSALFWRALLQWLGGMGIIVLSVAVLTRLTGGQKLIESESPGPSLHKLKPTIMQTAKLLWLIYVFFTIAEIVVLWVLGVDLYEAVYHAFTTMSTGGFSTRTGSIAEFTPLVHWAIMFFMIIAGTNFTLHYYAIHGKRDSYRKDPEFKLYATIIGFVAFLIAIDLIGSGYLGMDGVRDSAFQTISIMTTTGYATADFNNWSSFSRFLLLMIMFIGGCAGSTSGAIKNVRVLLMLKMLKRKLHQLLHPNAVLPVRLGKSVIPDRMLHTISMFFFAYLMIFVISTGVMLAFGMDMISGASASAACLGNVGPGLGIVGPIDSYETLHPFAKIWLSGCMWIGRLEIFTALILFVPSAYKREKFLE